MEKPASQKTVSFELKKEVAFGICVAVSGNIPALGNWDVAKSKQLAWSEGHVWKGNADLPELLLDYHIQYKYITTDANHKNVVWEDGGNRVLDLSAASSRPLPEVWNVQSSSGSKKLNTRKKLELSAEALANITTQIKAQAEKLRALRDLDPNKNAPVATKPEILKEAEILLELKHLGDAEFIASQNVKTMKVRWDLEDADGNAVRLQCPFVDRVSLTGAEIRLAIESVSHKHFPQLGKIARMELVEKPAKLSLDPVAVAALKKAKQAQKRKEKEERKAKANGGAAAATPKKEWKSKKIKEKKENSPAPAAAAAAPLASPAVSVVVSTEDQLKAAKAAAVLKLEEAKVRPLNDGDKIRLPLEFPGPLFKDSHTFVFRVQWQNGTLPAGTLEKKSYWKN